MKKGFTLIELLAVIVILAIIALIATPIVLSIIEETKESAVLRSAEHYLSAAELGIAKKNLSEGGSFSPNICEVQSDGNLLCDRTDELEIEVSGEKPSSGTITFDKGQITEVNLTYPNSTVTQNNKGELVLGESQEESICKLIDGEPNAIGSKYQCKVKDDMEEEFEDGYYFFVLSHNDDGTTNLIMERNMYYDEDNDIGMVATATNPGWIAWNNTLLDDNYSNGPITAMQYLHNATKDWANVPNMIMNYADENVDSTTLQKGTTGYNNIITTDNITIITNKSNQETGRLENLKTRMPEFNEVHEEGKCLTYSENGNQNGSCPSWLSNYIDNIGEDSGYWTLSSRSYDGLGAWFVSTYADLGTLVVTADRFGVRPVITLKI